MTDQCIYCHKSIEYDQALDYIKCPHCGVEIATLQFGATRKKIEAAQNEAARYKDELAKTSAEKERVLEDKHQAEELLKASLSELSEISSIQDEIGTDLSA